MRTVNFRGNTAFRSVSVRDGDEAQTVYGRSRSWDAEDRNRRRQSVIGVPLTMDYGLKELAAFTLFLDDGRIWMANNAAERAVRGIAKRIAELLPWNFKAARQQTQAQAA